VTSQGSQRQYQPRDQRCLRKLCTRAARRPLRRHQSLFHQPTCPIEPAGGAPRSSRNIFAASIYRSRRADELRNQPDGCVPSNGCLCRSHPQGCEARGPASYTVHKVRTGHQCRDRPDARPHRAADTTFHRRRGDRVRREEAMSMKTILVPTENDNAMRSALETALHLARRCNSYIEGFALRRDVSELVGVDGVSGVWLDAYRHDLPNEEEQAREIFELFMQEHNVPPSNKTTVPPSFGWFEDAPEGDAFVGTYGRVFDVIVMTKIDAKSTRVHNRAIETALFESGRPILLAPPSPPRQIATNVLVGWNCSTEQARATAFAMPLLRLADRVTVLTVIGGTGVPGPSAEQLIRYLQRNEIAAVPMSVNVDGRSTGEAILATAKSLDCDLLVKGAYTQSRLRQMIFGGATQHVLAKASLPVLLAN